MRSLSYHGKRVSGGQNPARHTGTSNPLLRVLFFPALFLYLEMVFHFYMKTNLAYTPIYLLYALAAGLFFTALTMPWKRKVNSVLTKVFALLFSLVYVVEVVCKQILQSYYALSSLKTAAGNRLTDYLDVIIPTVLRDIPIILVFFLPAILLLVFGNRVMGFERFDIRFSGIILAGALVVHLLGLGVVHLPWKEI